MTWINVVDWKSHKYDTGSAEFHFLPFVNVIKYYCDMFMHIEVIGTLTHLSLVPHICVRELGEHWFR